MYGSWRVHSIKLIQHLNNYDLISSWFRETMNAGHALVANNTRLWFNRLDLHSVGCVLGYLTLAYNFRSESGILWVCRRSSDTKAQWVAVCPKLDFCAWEPWGYCFTSASVARTGLARLVVF